MRRPMVLVMLALTLVLLSLGTQPLSRQGHPIARPLPGGTPANLSTLPLAFEPNTGQSEATTRYLAHTANGTLLFRPAEVVVTLKQSTGTQGQESATGTARRTRHAALKTAALSPPTVL